jgi:ABC-type phosphate transport system substrate-binding protein
MIRKLITGSGVLLASALATGGMAYAQAQDCVLPANALIVTGSTALEPFIKKIDPQLHAAGDISIYYVTGVGSCAGATQYIGDTNGPQDLGGKTVNHDYNSDGTPMTCTLPTGTHADLAVGDVFVESCLGGQKPAGYGDFLGPAAAFTLVVPKMSTQTAIALEHAYFIFGFGTAGYMGQQVGPWKDEKSFAIRNEGSGTQTLWAKYIHLPSAKAMKGIDSGSTGNVAKALMAANTSPAAAEPVIGIIAADAYDTNRANLKALAIQAYKQKHAYYPDSTANSFDKRNVRDGHYNIWGPSHIVAKVDGTGKAVNPRVQSFIDIIQMKKTLANVKLLDVFISAHVVPTCAMKVQRLTDDGDLMPYTPPAGTACGCYMDETLTPGASGCLSCNASMPCASGKTCSVGGFCE